MSLQTNRWLVCAALAAVSAAVLWPAARALACTSAVARGEATVDGRPLLWKNRDTSNRDNEIVYFDGELPFVAVCDAGKTGTVWAGLNEAGFAIINTLTRDIGSFGPRSSRGPGNGSFMKRALAECRSVAEFEKLLEATNESGRRTVATFSVIDAHGVAATFETAPRAFVRFDVDDPRVREAAAAPGLNVRSNFTYTAHDLSPGEQSDGLAGVRSKDRYDRAVELCAPLAVEGRLSAGVLLERVIRDHGFAPGYAGEGAAAYSVNEPPGNAHVDPAPIDTRNTISRLTSVSAIVIEGVNPGEDPRAATMWVLLGEPSLSVAVPVWVAAGKTSELVDGAETSPICDAAERLRDLMYVRTEDGLRLRAEALPGVFEDTIVAEREIRAEVERAVAGWRAAGAVDAEAALALHERACERALAVLRREVKQAEAALETAEPAAGG